MVLLTAGFVALLVLNTALARSSFTVDRLTTQQSALLQTGAGAAPGGRQAAVAGAPRHRRLRPGHGAGRRAVVPARRLPAGGAMTPPPGERSDRPSRSNPASRPARPPRTRGATTGRAVATKTARRPSPASRPARPARPQRAAKKRLPRQPHRIRLGGSPRRLRVALLCGALAMSVVVGRLLQLQGARRADVRRSTRLRPRTHTQVIRPVRGTITDRNGVVLATSVAAVDVTADQTKIPDPAPSPSSCATVLPQAGTVVDIAAKLTGDKQVRVRRPPGADVHVGAGRGPRPRGHLLAGGERSAPTRPRASRPT